MPDRVILLGAGASADASIPMAAELLPRVRRHLVKRYFEWERIGRPFDAVIGALQQRNALSGAPFAHVDIEAVFAALELLASRSSNLLAPFVVAWSPVITETVHPNFEERASRVSEELFRDLRNVLQSSNGGYSPSFRDLNNFKSALRDLGHLERFSLLSSVTKLLDL